jgi:hypothetical protein
VTVLVVNHLRFREPVAGATAEASRDAVRRIVDAGGLAAQVLRVDDRHLILVLTFASAADADRVSKEIGGPWMREHVIPLLAEPTERSVGEVIASA